MQRAKLNYLVDALALVAMVFLAVTGFLIRYKLPSGTGHYLALWGLDRHEWGSVHFWIAVTLLILVVVHLVLHWNWIVCMTRSRSDQRQRLRAGVAIAVLLVLAALAATPFLATVELTGQPPAGRGHGHGPDHDGPPIEGWMTLQDVETVTGIACETLVEMLNLPADVPLDERLGRLRRRYDFEMEAVREAVRAHLEQQ